MELYGTMLRYLALREIEHAQTALTVKEVYERLNEEHDGGPALGNRLARALKETHEQGFTVRHMVHIEHTKHAYSYSLTDKYFETKKQLKL